MNGPRRVNTDQLNSLGAYAALTVLLASLMIGGRAYNTDEMGLTLRTLLWLVVVGLIVLQTLFTHDRLSRYRDHAPGWIRISLTLLLVTALMTIELDLLKYTPLLPKKHDAYVDFYLFLLTPVCLVGGATLATKHLLRPTNRDDRASVGEGKPGSEKAELRVEYLQEKIHWVHVEEHYLHIQTELKRHCVRGKISDFIEGFDDEVGLLVHRSWWVAASEVSKLRKRGRDYQLILNSGEHVPVARSRLIILKNTQWFARLFN